MTMPTAAKNSPAFFFQAALSFAVALAAMIIAEVNVEATAWTRAFLALGTVFLVTSTFSVAKCVRDAQENLGMISRLDQVRLERLLAEVDPYELPPHLAALLQSPPSAGPAQAAGPAPTQGARPDPTQPPPPHFKPYPN